MCRPTPFAVSMSRPPVADLQRLMTLLGIDDPRLMMRTGEPVYAELALDDRAGDALLDAITRHPILLERPIFVVGTARSSLVRPRGSSSSSESHRHPAAPR